MPTATYNNVPNMSNMQTFRSVIERYGGLAKTSRFVVRINPNGQYLQGNATLMNDLSFLCEATELPGKNISTGDYRYYGPNQKYPAQTMYGDISLTFIVRNDMREKTFFDSWMNAINPISTYSFNYKYSYATTIDIFALSDIDDGNGKQRTNYEVKLIKAYPTAVNPMQMVWADDGYHRVQVQFAFSEWKRPADVTDKKFNLVDGSNSTFNSGFGQVIPETITVGTSGGGTNGNTGGDGW